ncbi:MAG: RHS repeat protein, partial [Acidobacteriaceae bacterium]|nr:RHS repeat protein [Acidobacteriaceae bacterium]
MSPSKQVRLVAVQEPASTVGGTESYVYDGSGQRVEKSGPGGTTWYVYDAFGQVAAEYASVAPTVPCGTCYLT